MIDKELVVLEGSPEKVGKEWGRINGKDIRKHLSQYFNGVKAVKGLTKKIVTKRAERYMSIINEVAPHWLKEAEAIAKEARVSSMADYMCFAGGRPRGIFFSECFSYISVGQASIDGTTFFHKNRDTNDTSQSAYVKAIVPDERLSYKPAKYISIATTSDISSMMMVNEKGLCGGADVGGIEKRPSYGGVMNHDILRYIAEKASTCEEAVEIVEDFTSKGWYTGGIRETHWLFADKKGTGVHIDNSSQKVKCKFVKDNFLINSDPDLRSKVAKKLLRKNFGRIDCRLMNFISQKKPICASSNVSSFTVRVSPDYTDVLSYAWVSLGRASETIYIPLYIGVAGTHISLVNGEIYRLHKKLEKGKILSRNKYPALKLYAVEEELESQRANLEANARLLLHEGKKEEAKRLLTEGCVVMARQTERILTLL